MKVVVIKLRRIYLYPNGIRGRKLFKWMNERPVPSPPPRSHSVILSGETPRCSWTRRCIVPTNALYKCPQYVSLDRLHTCILSLCQVKDIGCILIRTSRWNFFRGFYRWKQNVPRSETIPCWNYHNPEKHIDMTQLRIALVRVKCKNSYHYVREWNNGDYIFLFLPFAQ